MGIRILGVSAISAGIALWTLMPADQPAVDPLVLASISPPSHQEYTVSNLENGTACLIGGGDTLSTRSRQIIPARDCEAVWPGLSEARNWTQNEDGSVVLTKASGSAVLTLGLGDGVDFESIEPANAVLALNIVN